MLFVISFSHYQAHTMYAHSAGSSKTMHKFSGLTLLSFKLFYRFLYKGWSCCVTVCSIK
jgi:hypothetical protein